eukprot:CAMPEP_0178406544 /NCGR_PEP_ID=MMETSP0689_2-20121128/18965_1 /TAXON_ID=160604 /ORGANISM="Amphidinium massartii, Strain CS-259" /LENGTH=515 /DNA_ID=CAMNT_0020027585 /DNA_START=51 /DNA_END=1595 /DNA_ORIENTATION=+
MDLSQMSEEEQLQAAMELSLQVAGMNAQPPKGGPGGGDGGGAKMAIPARTARSFPQKDGQDSIPRPARQTDSAKKQKGEPKAGGVPFECSAEETSRVMRLIFGSTADPIDVERWLTVGFEFSEKSSLRWGLHQKKGGPCGVFAPVQGFMLKHLLFDADSKESVDATSKEEPLSAANDSEPQGAVLAHALTTILFNSTPLSSYTVCQVQEVGDSSLPIAQRFKLSGCRVTRASDVQSLLEDAAESWLAQRCGVLSFVCSMLLTRSIDTVKEDMDDLETPLIGRFGHCSQELVNLMLIGEATSNVFDGSKWLGDDPSTGLMVKGVDGDRVGVPTVGLLSELEAMRYLAVGTLFKNPDYPLWVIGSPTHYTLLFSTRRSDSQLSAEAQMEQRAKKTFVESAFDEGGLAMASNLSKMIDGVGLDSSRLLVEAQTALVREDIVLWEDFRGWVLRQYGLSDCGPQSGGSLRLFLYDGQDPPGPNVKQICVEFTDIDPSLARGGDSDAFTATLNTRWPNSIV